MVLRNISWETYERLLADHEDTSVPRFTYDRGDLEIMSPRPEHEDRTWASERIIEAFVLQKGIEFRNTRSSTFRRHDLERGFEADASFYIQNEAAVRQNNEFDLVVDPPPDLVIEIDVTNSSIDELSVFAAVGIPEVWRHAEGKFRFMRLSSGKYVAVEESLVLPGASASDVSFLVGAVGTTGRAAWLKRVQAWVQEILSDEERSR
jgi:Uma2 family endonuclease